MFRKLAAAVLRGAVEAVSASYIAIIVPSTVTMEKVLVKNVTYM